MKVINQNIEKVWGNDTYQVPLKSII